MGASRYVGRVGGLAVALGVGAAVLGGAGAAWADDASPASAGSGSTSAAASGSGAADTSGISGSGGSTLNDTHTAADTAADGADADLDDADDDDDDADTVVDVDDADIDVEDADTAEVAIASHNADSATDLSETESSGTDNPDVPANSLLLESLALQHARRTDSPAETATASAQSNGAELPAQAAAAVSATATQTQPVILGPSGVPIPSETYVQTVMDYYVLPNTTGDVATAQVVFTPEGLYPITGIKSLPLDTSVDQGLTILSDSLALLPAETTTAVFGYSQSAIIGSLLQAGYQPPNSPYPPPTIPADLQDSIKFIFVGNEMNPNGGLLSRFPNLDLPSLGIPFYGATPENAYPTVNYTREYDGFADFPRYPLNFLADLNAALGLALVHTKYATPPGPNCGSFCLTKQEVENAIELPTTDPTQRYFFIPTENLPLLQPLRLIPLIGNPLADLIQPVLKVLVNLGYGDPAHGFTSATQPYANVQVPFGLFPDVSPTEVLTQLVDGVGQGITDFFAAFGPGGSIESEIRAMSSHQSSSRLGFSSGGVIDTLEDVILHVADQISSAAASLYAPLLATADIINLFLTALPAYNVYLLLEGIQQAFSGDLIAGLVNAIGLPIAADVGLVTIAALVGVAVWADGILGAFDPGASIG